MSLSLSLFIVVIAVIVRTSLEFIFVHVQCDLTSDLEDEKWAARPKSGAQTVMMGAQTKPVSRRGAPNKPWRKGDEPSWSLIFDIT